MRSHNTALVAAIVAPALLVMTQPAHAVPDEGENAYECSASGLVAIPLLGRQGQPRCATAPLGCNASTFSCSITATMEVSSGAAIGGIEGRLRVFHGTASGVFRDVRCSSSGNRCTVTTVQGALFGESWGASCALAGFNVAVQAKVTCSVASHV